MNILRFLLIPAMVLLFSASAVSANGPKSKTAVNDNTVSSLLEGIKSDNFGLQTSSAFMLGELRISSGTIPLMRMLHSSDKEEARIMAALSLFKIESGKGMYAVKQAARFDESARVRKICQSLYYKSIGIEPYIPTTDFVSKW